MYTALKAQYTAVARATLAAISQLETPNIVSLKAWEGIAKLFFREDDEREGKKTKQKKGRKNSCCPHAVQKKRKKLRSEGDGGVLGSNFIYDLLVPILGST